MVVGAMIVGEIIVGAMIIEGMRLSRLMLIHSCMILSLYFYWCIPYFITPTQTAIKQIKGSDSMLLLFCADSAGDCHRNQA